ncbi:unnamed protein product [Gadus morhua 'NCC']
MVVEPLHGRGHVVCDTPRALSPSRPCSPHSAVFHIKTGPCSVSSAFKPAPWSSRGSSDGCQGGTGEVCGLFDVI